MDPSATILLLICTAALGIAATVLILRRDRLAEPKVKPENPYALASEGLRRCPSCGFDLLVTDENCPSCGKRLPR